MEMTPGMSVSTARPATEQPTWDRLPPALRPTPAVQTLLQEAWQALETGQTEQARALLQAARDQAQALSDRPGQARALAQWASLEEQADRVETAHALNQEAIALFLDLGDAAGLIQSYRLEGFIHLRRGEVIPGVTALARALALALQLDPAPVFVTLQQMVAVAGYLVEQDRVADLLPLAAAIQQAVVQVETVHADAVTDAADVAEMVRTVAGVFAPLGIMAQEPDLSPEQRRALAARSVHQAWLVDALTRRRWNLADMVKATLAGRLDFHEPLD